jgi:hypothetical protein
MRFMSEILPTKRLDHSKSLSSAFLSLLELMEGG